MFLFFWKETLKLLQKVKWFSLYVSFKEVTLGVQENNSSQAVNFPDHAKHSKFLLVFIMILKAVDTNTSEKSHWLELSCLTLSFYWFLLIILKIPFFPFLPLISSIYSSLFSCCSLSNSCLFLVVVRYLHIYIHTNIYMNIYA